MIELSYSKKGMVSTLAQVIICLDSRAVALIKTLSTYLGSSAGEFGYTGQQDPCLTRFPHFLIQVFFPLHYTSFVYHLGKKISPKHRALFLLNDAAVLPGQAPDILLFFFPIYIEGGLSPWVPRATRRDDRADLGERGCIRAR